MNPWKSIALCGWLLVPMLASHTINTAAERNSAQTQLIAAAHMQSTAHHNHRAQLAALHSRHSEGAASTVTECNPAPRAAIKLAGYTRQPPAQLALNLAAHDSGSWAAARNERHD